MIDEPYIKICGLTTDADIRAVAEAGATAAGFLVGLDYESADQLTVQRARELIGTLPSFLRSVVVTHGSDLASVSSLCEGVSASHLQIHGDLPLADLLSLRRAFPDLNIIKAVYVTGSDPVDLARATAPHVDAIHLDTRTAGRLGGTGKVHDWSISRAVVDAVWPTPVILAGGLTPDNVASAIATVRPFGVDVNSGVSHRRGVKSEELVASFVARARLGFDRIGNGT